MRHKAARRIKLPLHLGHQCLLSRLIVIVVVFAKRLNILVQCMLHLEFLAHLQLRHFPLLLVQISSWLLIFIRRINPMHRLLKSV
jgi:hypothetical protein